MTKRSNGEWRAFLKEAALSTSTECVEGGGTTRPWVKLDGQGMNASRAVWILANGDPGDLFVLHTCDNALCVNIQHLYLGTQSRNARDAFERNRRTSIRYNKGETVHTAKLTEVQVREIRKRYVPGQVSQQSLANEYGVTQPLIGFIVRGAIWKHLV